MTENNSDDGVSQKTTSTYGMTETIIVGIPSGTGQTERVHVTVDRTDWDRDGTLRCFADGEEIAEFPNARYAIHAEHLTE